MPLGYLVSVVVLGLCTWCASDQAVVSMELPGAQHSFDYFDTPRARLVANQIEAFTAWVRSRGHGETS